MKGRASSANINVLGNQSNLRLYCWYLHANNIANTVPLFSSSFNWLKKKSIFLKAELYGHLQLSGEFLHLTEQTVS